MGKIDDAIRASREREEKADEGPWRQTGETITNVKHHAVAACYGAVIDNRLSKNAAFIAQARTWEPRFRDALEVCVKEIQAESASDPTWSRILAEVERILEGK